MNQQTRVTEELKAMDCTIFLNSKPYDVRQHYAEHHPGAMFPATPTMTVCELAYAGGFEDAKPTYRKDGSLVTTNPDWCVVETDAAGKWVGATFTILRDCTRAIPLCGGKRFDSFPDGTY